MNKIQKEYIRISTQLDELKNELHLLQKKCKHPKVIKKHHSNTGNYDPSADCYWTEFNCPECKAYWSVDGSV